MLLGPVGVCRWWSVTFMATGCELAVTVFYHRRSGLPCGGDGVLPPPTRHMIGGEGVTIDAGSAYDLAVMLYPSTPVRCSIRQWWCNHQRRLSVRSDSDDVTINAGPAYDPAVMLYPSTPVRRNIRRWWCNHRRWLGIQSSGDDVTIDAGPAYHLAVTMYLSSLGQRTNRWWWWRYQRRAVLPSSDDDENINAGRAYHLAVMMRTSMPVRRTIRLWWWEYRCWSGVPSDGDVGASARGLCSPAVMRGSITAAIVFRQALLDSLSRSLGCQLTEGL
jgi:hypothetical protein